MAREADGVLYTRAGPEVGVAATKTHLAQIVAMELLALYLAQLRGTQYPGEIERLVAELKGLPEGVEHACWRAPSRSPRSPARFTEVRDFFFLGRGVGYPVALEGALKLKEISYLRAEGYPGGEMKHGPIALIEPGTVVVAVATRTHLWAEDDLEHPGDAGSRRHHRRGGGRRRRGDCGLRRCGAAVPRTHELFSPAIDVVALQVFAYTLAKAHGRDVDKPRNLAKTVTVE